MPKAEDSCRPSWPPDTLCHRRLAAITKRNIESKTRTRWSQRRCWGTWARRSRWLPGRTVPVLPNSPAKGSSQVGLRRLRAVSRSRSLLPQFFYGYFSVCFPRCRWFISPSPPLCKAAGSAVLHGVFCLYSSTFKIMKLFIHFYSIPSSLTAPDPTSLTERPAKDCRRRRRGACSCSDTQTGAAKRAKDHGNPSHQQKVKQTITSHSAGTRWVSLCNLPRVPYEEDAASFLPSFLQSCTVMGSLCWLSNSSQKRVSLRHVVSPLSPPTDLSVHLQLAWKGSSFSMTNCCWTPRQMHTVEYLLRKDLTPPCWQG